MGPAPMIRMVEMSVLLGIKSRGREFWHKKRARMLRVPEKPQREGGPRAQAVFRPVSAPAKPPKTAHQPAFWNEFGSAAGLPAAPVRLRFRVGSSFAGHASACGL